MQRAFVAGDALIKQSETARLTLEERLRLTETAHLNLEGQLTATEIARFDLENKWNAVRRLLAGLPMPLRQKIKQILVRLGAK